ncbi:peptidylprolyl isomerase [bacterium]|nr:peptidylprolyl isomerase [bacterium]
MKSTKLLATLLVAGMLFTGCGLKNSQTIIKVNDKAITQNDFDKLMDKQISASPFAKMGLGDIKNDKNGVLYLMTERSVVTQLVIEELLNQEAENRGIKVTNKDVDEAINKIIDKLGGKDKLSEILKQNNVSIKQLKSDIKTQVKMQKLAQATENVKVSDKEVKDFYDKNIDKFKHGEQIRAYHILLMTNPMQLGQEIASESKKELSNDELSKKIDEKVKANEELANKIAKELKADNSKFVEYAKKYSQDTTSAQKGGDLGYFEAKVMVPEFSKAAFAAKPNTVVGPVKTQFGYHVILVTDRRPAGTESFDKVKNNLKESLTNEKEIKAIDDIVNAAKKKAKIEYIDKQYDPEAITKKLTGQLEEMQKQANQAAPAAKK